MTLRQIISCRTQYEQRHRFWLALVAAWLINACSSQPETPADLTNSNVSNRQSHELSSGNSANEDLSYDVPAPCLQTCMEEKEKRKEIEKQLRREQRNTKKLEKALIRAERDRRKLETRLKQQDSGQVDLYSALLKTSTELIIQRYIPSISSSYTPMRSHKVLSDPGREEINQLVFILYGDTSKSMATRREILKRITRLEMRSYLANLNKPEREIISQFDLLLTQSSEYDGAIKRQYFPAFLTALYAAHGKEPEDTQIWYPYFDWLLEMVEEEKKGIVPANENYFLQLIIRFNNGE